MDRINKFYPGSYIIIVDNDSRDLEDIKSRLRHHPNVAIIVNDSDCMFEIGAYKHGIRFLAANNAIGKFDYIIFSQDTFVANQKFDFQQLKHNGIQAASFNHLSGWCDMKDDPIVHRVLSKFNLYDIYDGINFSLCWCNSFALDSRRVIDFYEMVKAERIHGRYAGSVQSERYLAGILYFLNDNSYHSICGDAITPEILGYDCWNVDIESNNLPHAFVKEVQQKREDTR